MKRIILCLVLLTTCNGIEDIVDPIEENVLSGYIDGNNTFLTNDKIWILEGHVIIEPTTDLLVQKGAIIKAKEDAMLIIPQGAKIRAVGTEEQPIIFTSIKDSIQLGEFVSPNLTEDDTGLWGGIIMLGFAQISAESGETAYMEGLPVDSTYSIYGGGSSKESDGSGKFVRVSVRHGNSLKFGGVKFGTTIAYVEMYANKGDGFAFFGGTVDTDYLITYAHGDDGIDIDQAFSGTINNSAVIQGSNSDNAMEIDGPEGNYYNEYLNTNITLVGNNVGKMVDFREEANGYNVNIFAFNFPESVTLDETSHENYLNKRLNFINWQVDHQGPVANYNIPEITKTILGNQSAGVDPSHFNWTLIAREGKLW